MGRVTSLQAGNLPRDRIRLMVRVAPRSNTPQRLLNSVSPKMPSAQLLVFHLLILKLLPHNWA